MLFFDITMSGCFLPTLLFPVVAACPNGLFSLLPLSPQLMCGIVALGCGGKMVLKLPNLFIGMISSLVHIFFQRHQSILPSNHKHKLSIVPRYIVISTIYIMYYPMVVWFTTFVPSNLEVVKLDLIKVSQL